MLRFLISFEDIFPKDKIYIKLYFLIILLTQNKELLIQYIKSFFSIDTKEIEQEIFNLNYNNPFSIIYIHTLLKI